MPTNNTLITSNGNALLSGNLTSGNRMLLDGTGVITLTGSNSCPAGLLLVSQISGQIVNLNSAYSVPASGVWFYNAVNNTIDNTSGAPITYLNGGQLQLTQNIYYSTAAGGTNNSMTFTSGSAYSIGASRTIAMNGAGNLTVNHGYVNGNAGNIVVTVNNGASNSGTFGSFTMGQFDCSTSSTNRTLTLGGNGNIVVNGSITNGTAGATGCAVTVSNSGSVIFTGSSSYGGATTISAGAHLQLGNGGTTGQLPTASAIVDNGNLIFNRSNAIVQGTDFNAAAITGTGTLANNGAGTLTLSNTNTYSGGTILNGGTTQVSGTASLGATAGVLKINNATLEVTTGFTGSRNIQLGSANSAIYVDEGQTYTASGTLSNVTGTTGGLNVTGPRAIGADRNEYLHG